LPDIQSYLNFRLRAVGYTGPDLFSYKVARTIASYSHGLVRRINIIADKTLLFAYTQDRHTLQVKDIHQVAKDSNFKPLKSYFPWLVAASFAAFLIVGTLYMYAGFNNFAENKTSAVELAK
jgi:hypothetical protein